MTRPGVEIAQRDTPASRSVPADTSVAFVVGLTDRGPLEPVLVTSIKDYSSADKFGPRVTYGLVYDTLDVAFRDGLSRAYVSRVVGPAPTSAQLQLKDASNENTLLATATSAGAWANNVTVQVSAGTASGEFILTISESGSVVETSPSLVDKTAAIAWAAGSDYLTLTSNGTGADPDILAATPLAGGDDDRANVTDAEWADALDLFTRDLGPGQVAFPGRTTSTAGAQLLTHAAARNRVAVLDLPDTPTKSTLTSAVAALRTNGRYGAAFAPWVQVPGVTPGSTRTVPPSAVVLGLIGRNDSAGASVNQPSAGFSYGDSNYATGVTQTWVDDTREDLNDAGVNVIRGFPGVVEVYGWRSLDDPGSLPDWLDFSNGRLYMAIAAKANAIAETYVLKQIDGRRRIFARLNGELTGMLTGFFNQDALYGDTPPEAFSVNTGPSVNTDQTIAAREIHATINVRMSPMGELVVIEISKTATTEVLA